MQENYPWLDSSPGRKYMSDKEVLDKYVDLDKSCLTDEEKKQVLNMLYKYKDAFSLRDEIGMSQYRSRDRLTDKSPFFIRPYHINEEDKMVLDK